MTDRDDAAHREADVSPLAADFIRAAIRAALVVHDHHQRGDVPDAAWARLKRALVPFSEWRRDTPQIPASERDDVT